LPFLLKKRKELNSAKCRKGFRVEKGKKRGKCHSAFQTLPVGSKELDRFCNTGTPSNNVMGIPDVLLR
jgi:hypothetical protein